MSQSAKSNKLLRATLLILALLIGGAMRFADLKRLPLWVDELATLQRLSLSFPEHVVAMRGNHPLYELTLRFLVSPFATDRELRVPSAVMGTISILLLWLAVRRTNKWAAVIAACLLAISPLHLMYSRIARPYCFSTMLALLNILAFQWALRRRKFVPFAAYALVSAALIYSNLIGVTLCVAEGLFVIWRYRCRPVRVLPWFLAGLAVIILMTPWIIYSMPGAVTWGVETKYTARQFGLPAKAAYLLMTFCLGETVHPLNVLVILPAFVGFGAAALAALVRLGKKWNPVMCLFLLQLIVGYAAGLAFNATASKHLLIIIPAACGLIAFGLAGLSARRAWLAAVLALLVASTSAASDFNYFTGRQFADADMVTPWKEIAGQIEHEEMPGQKIIIGYRPDRGAYDMFIRYYRGRDAVSYLDFTDWKADLGDALKSGDGVWLLLHDGDPWQDIETWLKARGASFTFTPIQEEEHTLQGLREGLRNVAKYKSPLYRLYFVHKE